jgi:hypothetical protein
MTGPALAAADPPVSPATVQLSAVALPVVVDGRLINYVFVTVRLNLAAGVDGAAIRAKEPFFRDALVKAAHRHPFTLATDFTQLDAGRIRAEVMSEANAIAGPGSVRNVEVIKQVSQHRNLSLPAPKAARPELIP